VLGQRADAEDATQEIFLRLREKAAQFAGHGRFSTWLYRLAVNHCLNRLAAARGRGGAHAVLDELDPPAAPGPSPFEVSERGEECTRAAALLARLSVDHRSVLVLREIEGLSYERIAEALDVPVGTVMSRLARAREHLARIAPHRAEPARAVQRSSNHEDR
jgi:RNA polymerase sigma-70 factor (ECF subfamily)